MISAFLSLFSWLPPGLVVLIAGAVTIVMILLVVHIVKLILDIIPFV